MKSPLLSNKGDLFSFCIKKCIKSLMQKTFTMYEIIFGIPLSFFMQLSFALLWRL